MYLAYLKFGFGRATTDASIDLRAGKLTRNKGLKLVKELDHLFPTNFIDDYLNYFKMKRKDFFDHLENFRNKKIFKLKNKKWILDEN